MYRIWRMAQYYVFDCPFLGHIVIFHSLVTILQLFLLCNTSVFSRCSYFLPVLLKIIISLSTSERKIRRHHITLFVLSQGGYCNGWFSLEWRSLLVTTSWQWRIPPHGMFLDLSHVRPKQAKAWKSNVGISAETNWLSSFQRIRTQPGQKKTLRVWSKSYKRSRRDRELWPLRVLRLWCFWGER